MISWTSHRCCYPKGWIGGAEGEGGAPRRSGAPLPQRQHHVANRSWVLPEAAGSFPLLGRQNVFAGCLRAWSGRNQLSGSRVPHRGTFLGRDRGRSFGAGGRISDEGRGTSGSATASVCLVRAGQRQRRLGASPPRRRRSDPCGHHTHDLRRLRRRSSPKGLDRLTGPMRYLEPGRKRRRPRRRLAWRLWLIAAGIALALALQAFYR